MDARDEFAELAFRVEAGGTAVGCALRGEREPDVMAGGSTAGDYRGIARRKLSLGGSDSGSRDVCGRR